MYVRLSVSHFSLLNFRAFLKFQILIWADCILSGRRLQFLATTNETSLKAINRQQVA